MAGVVGSHYNDLLSASSLAFFDDLLAFVSYRKDCFVDLGVIWVHELPDILFAIDCQSLSSKLKSFNVRGGFVDVYKPCKFGVERANLVVLATANLEEQAACRSFGIDFCGKSGHRLPFRDYRLDH